MLRLSAAAAAPTGRALRFASTASAVLIEHANGLLAKSNAAVIRAAQAVSKGNVVGVLALGPDDGAVEGAAAALDGLSKVYAARSSAYSHMLPEAVAPLLAALQRRHNFTHWWCSHSAQGKNILPRLAGSLLQGGAPPSVAPISDVIAVKDATTFLRPIYAGNAIATVRTSAAVTILTVRASSFPEPAAPPPKGGAPAPIEAVPDAPAGARLAEWLSEEVSKSDRPDLASADIVVSGGRALKSSENFALLHDLADALGGAASTSPLRCAASRPNAP